MKIPRTVMHLLAGVSVCFGLVAPAAAQSMADCTLAAIDNDSGPIKKSLYVVGTFPGATWLHVPARKMAHKGKGLYQVVVEEKAGNVKFQFATINWSPQFTAKGLAMTVGAEAPVVMGGFEKDTAVALPSDGRYVWSIQVDENQKPVRGMVSPCK